MGLLDLNDISYSSKTFGTELVTLVNGKAQGPNVPCRTCLIKPDKDNTSPVFVCDKAADGSEYPLPDTDLPMPVTNLNKLYFSSAMAAAKVHIMWRL